jgi:molybdopterin-containing oxidoreductase family iron-sulfur binding subunit
MATQEKNNYRKHLAGTSAPPVTEGERDALDVPAGAVNRRSFLRAAGFTGLLAAAGCTPTPIQKLIPTVSGHPDYLPGRDLYYATVCGGCEAGCGALVKCRDGRPIKLEGLPGHPLSAGGLCAVGQATLLGLYDSRRFAGPRAGESVITWQEADQVMKEKLAQARAAGGKVRLLTRTVNSPALEGAMARFLGVFEDGRHVMYDALSQSAIADAHLETHGARLTPKYRFEACDVIVSFGADFLGTWISPVEFTAGYRVRRNPEEDSAGMSHHVQFEPWTSLTGSNADARHRIPAGHEAIVLGALEAEVSRRLGMPVSQVTQDAVPLAVLEATAARLTAAKGASLVICGSQDIAAQRLCNSINQKLGNYEKTLSLRTASRQKRGDDIVFMQLLAELEAGALDALVIADCNPVAELPEGARFAKALERVELVVYCGERPNETSRNAGLICPTPHFLESWGDAEPVSGIVALEQPVVAPFFDTRPLIESLHTWFGEPASALGALQAYWREMVHPRARRRMDFQAFWDKALHDGFARVRAEESGALAFTESAALPPPAPAPEGIEEFDAVFYPKCGLLEGRHAFNPWLQELPDPVSKVTWDNYACISVETSRELGLTEGDVVRIEADGLDTVLELPVYVQPGLHNRTVAMALGYGMEVSERFAGVGPQWLQAKPAVGENGRVGVNAAPLLHRAQGRLRYERAGVRVVKTNRRLELAATQTHHTITVPKELALPGGERRPMIQEASLDAFLQDPHAGGRHGHHATGPLYPPDHATEGPKWGMVIDLTACTGCSACVIACQAENNISVVGRDEVRRRRDMHWMRIDRYYSGEGDEARVAHQPMICQHCDNAPCENVCPVLATVQTEDGLNAQVYNRCVGTRYCANNCPYKVRRFNWFHYRREDAMENLVLNPDVTVRSRGVMEKCSFCVQRIQEARREAKRRGEPLADGAVRTACQQSCPAQAIVFGDMNDPESRISKLIHSGRHYRVLEELGVQPAVGYLTLIRNGSINEEGQRPEELHHG